MTVFHARVAGLRIDLVVDGAASPGLERWAPYACPPGAAEVVLALTPGRPESLRRLTGRVVVEGGRWYPGGAEHLGWLDPATGRGEAVGDPWLVVADALARAALARSVAARGGVLVHGAALEVDGRAHLVPGHSGAGKSTLARRAGHVLCDELAAVFPGAQDEPPEVFGTPWWRSSGGQAPLASVYRLAWGEPEVTPLHGPGLLRHLAQGLVLPFDDPAERARAFSVCGALARAVPFARLAFRPDTDVDALLRRQPAWRAA
jgi:hypothetical protein